MVDEDPYNLKNLDFTSFPDVDFLTDHPSTLQLPSSSTFYDPSLMFSELTNNYPSNNFNFSYDDIQTYLENPIPQFPSLPPPIQQKKSTVLPSSILEKGDSSSTHHRLQSEDTNRRSLNLTKKGNIPCISALESTSRKTHNVSQRKRRNKVKEKLKTLKDHIPNCDKKDMTSVLDKATKYIQFLEIQVQQLQMQQAAQRAMEMSQTPIPIISPLPPRQMVSTSYFPTMPPCQYPLQLFPMNAVMQQPDSFTRIPIHVTTTATTTTTTTDLGV